MRVRARSIKGVAVEDVCLSFENGLTDDTVVCSVDRKDEGSDGVTTVRSLRRVAVRTRLCEILIHERIGRSLADRCMDRVMNRFDDIELDTPEERFFVDYLLVMIQAGSV